LGFHHKNDQGNGSQQPKSGDFSRFYGVHLLSTI
jgi:hypothetical protein